MLFLKLRERVDSALANPKEISDDLIENVITETMTISENKEIPEPFLLDLAYYRLVLTLKIELSEFEQKDYARLLKVIKESKPTALSTVVIVNRKFEWD